MDKLLLHTLRTAADTPRWAVGCCQLQGATEQAYLPPMQSGGWISPFVDGDGAVRHKDVSVSVSASADALAALAAGAAAGAGGELLHGELGRDSIKLLLLLLVPAK
jgi:hypothetical protein